MLAVAYTDPAVESLGRPGDYAGLFSEEFEMIDYLFSMIPQRRLYIASLEHGRLNATQTEGRIEARICTRDNASANVYTFTKSEGGVVWSAMRHELQRVTLESKTPETKRPLPLHPIYPLMAIRATRQLMYSVPSSFRWSRSVETP